MARHAISLALVSVAAVACSTADPAERPQSRATQPIGQAPASSKEVPPGSQTEVAPAPEPLLEERGVKALQRALIERGIEAPTHGRFDAATQRAVLEYQRREGLAATSMPDLATLQHLGLDAHRLYR